MHCYGFSGLIRFYGPCIWNIRCLSAYYGAVYGMQVVGNWLSCPWHWAPERRKLHHTHYCANIYRKKSTEIYGKSQTKTFQTSHLFLHQLRYSPLKFRLFILKFRGAKGLEDTIFPPEKKTKTKKIFSVQYCLLSISFHSSSCQELCSVQLVMGERSSAKSWHNGNPQIFKVAIETFEYFSSEPRHQFQE